MKKHSLAYPIRLLILSTVFTFCVAQPASRSWNLNNVDIRNVIVQVAEETGKNFIIDPRVQGKVTLITQKPMSPDELYQVFLSLLEVHGFAAVNHRNNVEIVPIGDAKTASLPMNFHYDPRRPSELAVRVIHVNYVDVSEVVRALKPLVDKNQLLGAYGPSNDLIIAGTVRKIQSLADVVSQLDKPREETEMITLKHASAEDVAKTLQELEGNNNRFGKKGTQIRVAVDERTNSVLLSGDKNRRLHFRSLVMKMDVADSNSGNTQVIYLKYVNAKDLAPIIGNLINAYEPVNKQAGGAIRSQSSSNGSDNGGINLGPRFIQRQGSNVSSDSQTGGNSTTIPANAGLSENQGPKSGTAGPHVQWEEATNSLIIKAPPGVMRTVRSVIAKLDIRRPQVLVEAIIAEVSMSRLRELGVELNTNGQVPVGTRFPNNTGTTSLEGTLGGSGVATIVGRGLTVGFLDGNNLRAIVKALGSDTAANILATPNIVTLDNEIANIRVGQLVPFAIGQSTNNLDGGGTPFTSFRREEVGLSLTIRPQITRSGAIKLHIENILSSVIPDIFGTSAGAGSNPTTSERVITTNVIVDDGNVLVLGGLIQKEWEVRHQKVPLIGDVPIIGKAFRDDTRRLVKTNLMIFLKPTILRNSRQSIHVSSDKYNYTRKEQLESEDSIREPFRRDTITMPALHPKPQLPSPFLNGMNRASHSSEYIK